jgi:methanogenic corrinoid protein MtbC1
VILRGNVSETLYPIRAVVKLTGVNPATIDSWERRHGALKPKHGVHGRLYSEQEVQRIRLLRDAIAKGHHIRHLAKTEDEQLRLLAEFSSPAVIQREQGFQTAVAEATVLDPLLEMVADFDYSSAERELNRLAAATADPREVVHEIALPLMRITGERWHEGDFTIAQEHMVTALLTGMLTSMLRLYVNPKPAARVLLATPENEHHGFGILAAAMLTAAKGLGALHLGTNLPASEIVFAARSTEADAVLLGVCGANTERVIHAMQEIRQGAKKRTQLWIGGSADETLLAAAEKLGWLVMKNFHEFEDQLDVLAAGV